ncbi:MAG: exonuclease domain-containing protein, partial [Oscillospiraceae bacterium]|nr:exonuclease domain-containing protein [Oscillospiraceae bacterium]
PDDPRAALRYVVVDLEWNQYPKWVRTPISREGVVMPHEIIQIGAVKVDGLFRVVDTFMAGVRLQGRRKLSKHVARVIQKTQEEIDQGDDFPVAYAHFSDWSADAERFITWGPDDLRVFQNNLNYYKMGELDPAMWYDAQKIYAKQVRCDRVQMSLKGAAEAIGFDDSAFMHHDALQDAYITVGVCHKLDMTGGMDAADEAPKPKPKPRVSDNKLFMQKKFISASSEDGFTTRALAKRHCAETPICCPACGEPMVLEKSVVSSGDRWMKMAVCADHGKHLVRYRTRHRADGEFFWNSTVYAPDAELEQYYRDKVQVQRPRRHRGRGGKRPAGAAVGSAAAKAEQPKAQAQG